MNRNKIRKTIPFHIHNDAFVLDYINERVEAGEDFSAVVKQLLTMMITLLTFFPPLLNLLANGGGMSQGMTQGMTQLPDENPDFANPFAELTK